MRIDLLTLFPQLYRPWMRYGMVGQAVKQNRLEFYSWSLRRFAGESPNQVDDRAYGGVKGMVMRPEPYFKGVEKLREYGPDNDQSQVIITDAGGRQFDQSVARRLSQAKHLIFLTGRYEGVDQRVKDHLVDEAISLGPFVTPDGDLPAMVIISAIARLLPGVVGNEKSVELDSYQGKGLAPPLYTRPASYRGLEVPPVLLSGDHGAVSRWREEQAEKRTRENRSELLD